MANDNVTSIKALNDALATTLKTLNSISEQIKDIAAMQNDAANTMRASVSSRGGHKNLGAGNKVTQTDTATFSNGTGAPSGNAASGGGMMNWMSRVAMPLVAPQAMSTQALVAGTVIQGVGQMAAGVAGAAYSMAPDLGTTVGRAAGYYTAAQYGGGLGYTQLQKSTLGALNANFGAGVSGPGDDAMAATSLVQGSHFMPGSTAYNAAMGEIGGAYRALNMNNVQAAQAIGGFQTGTMGASLYGIGISTAGPNGQQMNETQIAQALYKRIFQGPGKKTAQNIMQSEQQGLLGADLTSLGFTQDQQNMLVYQFQQIAQGKNPDLSQANNTGNPLAPQQAINASQTNLMQAAQSSMIAGFQDAAKVIGAVNKGLISFGTALDAISKTKGFAEGMSQGGSSVGKGITSFFGGLVKGAATIAEGIGIGLMIGGGGTPGFGADMSTGRDTAVGITPGAVAGTNTLAGGGGGTVSPIQGVNPTVPYGATGSQLWNTPSSNSHTGEDFAVPVGTPVQAVAAGTVFDDLLSSDYGTYVQIDHGNGYTTLYGHLSSKEVKVGDKVKAGQRIGRSGQSGNVSGPHLHFEVRKGKNNPVDPAVINTPNFIMGMVSGSQEYTLGTILGTGSQQAWAKDFLKQMGDPVTTQNVKAMTTWMAYEGGQWKNTAHYNPLNTTLSQPGATDINGAGVKSYTSYSQGLSANVNTLNENQRGYAAIRAALLKGTSTQDVLTAVNNSAWGTHIGGGTPGFGASVPAPATKASVVAQGPTTTSGSSGGNNITINVTVAQASDEEAIRLAKKVKSYLDDKNSISIAGSR
jgi:murein DD-endopeptidase MepM/ murein hydrolase activator NlpD